MSNPADSPKEDVGAPTPEAEPELSEEQLDEVAGGGVVIAESSLDTTTSTLSTSTELGPAPHLGPQPHLSR
jgi:hypothetical protein